MGQRARTGQGFELLALLCVQLQRGQGSSQFHRHLHSPQKVPQGKLRCKTYISYLRDTTLVGSDVTNQGTWSGITSLVSMSTPYCCAVAYKMCLSLVSTSPTRTLRRYFGQKTMWYDKLKTAPAFLT